MSPAAYMTVEFYPTVQTNINRALGHCEVAGGPHLAEKFEGEFRARIAAIQTSSWQFSFYLPARTASKVDPVIAIRGD